MSSLCGTALLVGITASYTLLLVLHPPDRPMSQARTNLLVLSRQQILHYLAEVVEGGSLLRLAVPALNHDLVAAETERRVRVGITVDIRHPTEPPRSVDMGPRLGRKLTLHWWHGQVWPSGTHS